jgi:hypothetical protein
MPGRWKAAAGLEEMTPSSALLRLGQFEPRRLVGLAIALIMMVAMIFPATAIGRPIS